MGEIDTSKLTINIKGRRIDEYIADCENTIKLLKTSNEALTKENRELNNQRMIAEKDFHEQYELTEELKEKIDTIGIGNTEKTRIETSDIDENETIFEDAVNHPNHYCQGGHECIDEMLLVFGVEAVRHFCLLNVWKYRKRALFKNGKEDCKKADWYMNKYFELSESEE